MSLETNHSQIYQKSPKCAICRSRVSHKINKDKLFGKTHDELIKKYNSKVLGGLSIHKLRKHFSEHFKVDQVNLVKNLKNKKKYDKNILTDKDKNLVDSVLSGEFENNFIDIEKGVAKEVICRYKNLKKHYDFILKDREKLEELLKYLIDETDFIERFGLDATKDISAIYEILFSRKELKCLSNEMLSLEESIRKSNINIEEKLFPKVKNNTQIVLNIENIFTQSFSMIASITANEFNKLIDELDYVLIDKINKEKIVKQIGKTREQIAYQVEKTLESTEFGDEK